MNGERLGKTGPVPSKYTPQEREAGAREDYHDPTAGIGGAPPARSAITMRLILTSFGLIACTAGAVFLTAVIQPPIAAAWAFFAAVALADLVVVARRKLRGEPG
jgi:hypothetical protein